MLNSRRACHLVVALLAALAAPRVEGGILNVVPGAHAAYSLRRLNDDYAGYAVEVRRASDNAVLGIGFNAAGQLDTSTLLAFVGSSDGYVTTWYDQAGAHNLSQALASLQPQIVAGGSVLTDSTNGLPGLRFSSDSLGYVGSGMGSETMSILAAGAWAAWTDPPSAQNSFVSRRLWTMREGAASKAAFGGQDGKFAVAWAAPGIVSATTNAGVVEDKPFVASYVYDATQAAGADTIHWYLDGELEWSQSNLTLAGIANVNRFDVGSLEGTMRFFDGTIQELIVYHGLLTEVDRASVENSMMSRYIPEPTAFAALFCAAMLWLARRRRR